MDVGVCMQSLTHFSDGTLVCDPWFGVEDKGAIGCTQADWADVVSEADWGGEAREGDVIIISVD